MFNIPNAYFKSPPGNRLIDVTNYPFVNLDACNLAYSFEHHNLPDEL